MKTRLLIIVLAISVSIGIFFYAQNILLNEQIQMTIKNNNQLQSALKNYTDTFGNISFEQDIRKSPWTLETKTFVASAVQELIPIDAVKVGEQYSVTATVTRPTGIADYPPLLGYVMYVQVHDSDDKWVVGSWHNDVIMVNQTKFVGTYWSPETAGNYTVEVFAWQSFTGTPHAEATRINVEVVE
jgi:hypothetical protein